MGGKLDRQKQTEKKYLLIFLTLTHSRCPYHHCGRKGHQPERIVGGKESSCSGKRCLQSKSNQLENTNNLHTDNPQHCNTWQTKHWLSPHKRVRYTVLDSKRTVSAWSWANREMSNHKDLRDSDKGQTRQLGPTEVVQGTAQVTAFWLAKTGLCSLMLQKSYSSEKRHAE